MFTEDGAQGEASRVLRLQGQSPAASLPTACPGGCSQAQQGRAKGAGTRAWKPGPDSPGSGGLGFPMTMSSCGSSLSQPVLPTEEVWVLTDVLVIVSPTDPFPVTRARTGPAVGKPVGVRS